MLFEVFRKVLKASTGSYSILALGNHNRQSEKIYHNIVQVFLLWIEVYVREYRSKTAGLVGAESDEYIQRMKLEYFPRQLCLTSMMADLNLSNSIENLEIIKMRQEKTGIIAFTPKYLEKYLQTLKNEVTRRRLDIFDFAKENVPR